MTDKLFNLEKVPNQEFTFDNGDDHWRIVIKTVNTSMACDLYLNSETLLLGSRIVNGRPIIAYEHLTDHGNFAIMTESDDAPWWEKFGSSQTLVYWNDSND